MRTLDNNTGKHEHVVQDVTTNCRRRRSTTDALIGEGFLDNHGELFLIPGLLNRRAPTTQLTIDDERMIAWLSRS